MGSHQTVTAHARQRRHSASADDPAPRRTATALRPFAEDAPQTHAYPAVEARGTPSGSCCAGSRRTIPAGCGSRPPRCTAGFVPTVRRVFARIVSLSFGNALLPRPVFLAAEAVAQEVEAGFARVDDLASSSGAVSGRCRLAHCRTSSNARSASSAVRHRMTKSSAYRTIS